MAEKKQTIFWHNVQGITEQELEGDPEVLKKYGDIIDIKWDGVRHHKKQLSDVRSAQFAPFAALSGFEDMIEETEIDHVTGFEERSVQREKIEE